MKGVRDRKGRVGNGRLVLLVTSKGCEAALGSEEGSEEGGGETNTEQTDGPWLAMLCQSDGLGDEGGSPGQQRQSDQPTQADAGLISAAPVQRPRG